MSRLGIIALAFGLAACGAKDYIVTSANPEGITMDQLFGSEQVLLNAADVHCRQFSKRATLQQMARTRDHLGPKTVFIYRCV